MKTRTRPEGLPVSEEQPKLPNRQSPFSEAFIDFIPKDWEPHSEELPAALPASGPAAERRAKLSEQFPGERLVIPAGGLKVRSNDTDYRFRAHSAFAWLTGLGSDREPDAVLVMEPVEDGGHDATLYFKPRAPRTDREFYADARYGEMWVGQRESLTEMSAMTGIGCAPVADLEAAWSKNLEATEVRLLRESEAAFTDQVDQARQAAGLDLTAVQETDAEFEVALSEARLIKDDFEIAEMTEACRQTGVAFEAVVREFPEAVRRGRGERWVEGVFGLHARHGGNGIGYDTIAAAGDHANTLHWIRNDGEVRDGDLILIDAGVELDSLYTADVTRTLPVNGRFTAPQRQVYEAVLEAQRAGIAAAQVGAEFADVHRASIAVVAKYLWDWGILPVPPEEALGPDGGQQRRWMVHGTSHHLGIDVHDCARARAENYRQGTLQPGMIITVEPGIYLRANDQLVPDELRGIGVRIEDDILITEDGPRVLSDQLPVEPDAIEEWMAQLLG
ncbi:aminopeptidase P family protein [Parenemella sanctibonifatiensis]|uniref:Xaa-Pro aminopeptidase n=1 Tax=Parenemella sanctibonifatiensis TaxID=2016505 RepID=A0A255EDX7_9ACTN|nr:Xaa-Pro aminopeptidase [Parenemella sanctibonifatiensis]